MAFPAPRMLCGLQSRARSSTAAIGRAVLVVALLAAAGCSDDDAASRARFREAVAEQDLVGARAAALALGREGPDTPEAVVEVARMLADIGEMNEARWLLEAAVARHPGHVDLTLGLAETSLLVGDAASALSALAALPRDSPRAAYAEVLRARAAMMTGSLEEGLAALNLAEQRFEEPVLFRTERIDLLMAEARFAEALDVVREMQTDPAVPAANRPWLALRESDLVGRTLGGEAALPLLDALLETDPGFVDAARSRTSILIALGRAEQAREDLERLLAAQPEMAALHGLAAQAALASGDLEAAEAHLRRHAEGVPDAPALAALAQFLRQQGRSSEAVAVLASVPETANPAHRIELRYQRIAMQIELGELEQARSGVAGFARDHPSNPRVDYLLARLDLAEGRPEEAARRLALALSRLDRTDVRHLLGVALEGSGDLAGAEVQYGIVTMQGPSQVPSWAGLLRVLEAQQKWERLASAAQLAARITPIRNEAVQSLARARIALGQVAEAEQILRGYSRERLDLVEPRIGLSLALRRQGRFDEALRVLDEASYAQQHDPRLVAERVTVLGMAGRAAEALGILDAMTGDEHAAPALRNARIYLLFASGRSEDALAEAARAARLAPDDAVPHRMVADHLASTGGFEASLEYYRRAALLSPSAADLWFRMAIALEGSGRDEEAVEAYLQAIRLDPDAVGARNNLALVLGRGGRTREAITVAQAAHARAENDAVVLDTLASLYLDAGLARRAAAMLEKARRLAPESEDVPYHLALAYRDMGRHQEALQLLTELDERVGPDRTMQGRIEDALSSLR